MFYLYNSSTAFRRLARDLEVSVYYPYQKRSIKRRKSLLLNVNIGCARAELPEDTLNKDISTAISKKLTFTKLDEGGLVRHPPIFSTPEEASAWEYGWLGRRDGLSGGRGIAIFEKGQLPLQAAQYDFITGIIPGKAEYRIHVGKLPDNTFTIIATQQKVGVRNNESIIRNHASGVIYSQQDLRMSEKGRTRAKEWAIHTVQAVGLDFGAVDLLQSIDGKLYVLEVNTAPGISSEPMFDAYLEYFQQWMEE